MATQVTHNQRLFGNALQRARVNKGMTRMDVINALEAMGHKSHLGMPYSVRTFRNWEQGWTSIAKKTVGAIETILGPIDSMQHSWTEFAHGTFRMQTPSGWLVTDEDMHTIVAVDDPNHEW